MSGWALCFDFFSSSLRSNASPLSYAARTSLEGLQSLSPSTYKFPPHPPFTLPQPLPLPFPALPISSSWLPVLMCRSSSLCLTPIHVGFSNAEKKASLLVLTTFSGTEMHYSYSFRYRASTHTLFSKESFLISSRKKTQLKFFFLNKKGVVKKKFSAEFIKGSIHGIMLLC